MHQTGYKVLSTIGAVGGSYVGGFCRWWYIPKENIAVFPAVDPLTQMLTAEPSLKAGCTWYGPVNVPDGQLGWDENLQQAKAGIWYKEKVYGFIVGMDIANHINLENLSFHQLVVVGKARSGGNYYIIGNDHAGLDLVTDATIGQGAAGTAGTKLTLAGDLINKALVLPSFTANNTISPVIVPASPASTPIVLTGTASYTIPAYTLIDKIVFRVTSPVNLSIGLTAGGTEILDVIAIVGISVVSPDLEYPVDTVIYFNGIQPDTIINIFKR